MQHDDPDTHARRSKIALGLAIICGVFLLETSFAHRAYPSAWSPWVWGALATMGLGCLVFSVFSAWKAKSPR